MLDDGYDRAVWRLRRWFETWVILVTLVWASGACAMPFSFSSTAWDGCSRFVGVVRRALGVDRVQLRATLPWGELSPADGLIILHPLQAIDEREVVAFMVAGGRVAVVDDHGYGDALLSRFNITRKSLPSDPVSMLRSKATLPLATVVMEGDSKQVHPTVASVRRVALNHATGLSHPGLSPVLEVKSQSSPAVAVAVAGQVGKGRLFAMSDPSVFINEMMRYPDNRQFAKAVAQYLTGGDRSSSGKLWLYSQRFDQRPGFAPSTTLVESMQSALSSLFLELRKWARSVWPPWMWLVVSTSILLVLGWKVRHPFMAMYRERVPGYAKMPGMSSLGGLAGRIDVLGAASTAPALAFMELRLLLVEGLRASSSAGGALSLPELVGMWRNSEAHRPELDERLDGVVELLERVEKDLVRGRLHRPKRASIEAVASLVDDVLETVEVMR